MTDGRLYLHLGVVTITASQPATFDEWTDTTVEHELVVDAQHSIWVSGSWKCWGTANQDTDGDESLHLVAEVTEPLYEWSDDEQRIFFAALFRTCRFHLGHYSRLLDFGIVAGDEIHDRVAVVTVLHNEVVIYPITRSLLLD